MIPQLQAIIDIAVNKAVVTLTATMDTNKTDMQRSIDGLGISQNDIEIRVTTLENNTPTLDIEKVKEDIMPMVKEVINTSLGTQWKLQVIETIRLKETNLVISSSHALSLNSNDEFRFFCENALKMSTIDSKSITATSVKTSKIGNRFLFCYTHDETRMQHNLKTLQKSH